MAYRLGSDAQAVQWRDFSPLNAPRVARRAETTAFAGIGDEEVMPAVITGGLGKTASEDAAFKVFAKRLADKGLGRVVWSPCPSNCPALASLCQVSKCPAMALVEQHTLRAARVVELGVRVAGKNTVQIRYILRLIVRHA